MLTPKLFSEIQNLEIPASFQHVSRWSGITRPSIWLLIPIPDSLRLQASFISGISNRFSAHGRPTNAPHNGNAVAVLVDTAIQDNGRTWHCRLRDHAWPFKHTGNGSYSTHRSDKDITCSNVRQWYSLILKNIYIYIYIYIYGIVIMCYHTNSRWCPCKN